MDARERLRQFLEQRRELGEREFVLDGMDVEEVLRVIGAVRAQGEAAQAGDRAAGREMLDAARRGPGPEARSDAPRGTGETAPRGDQPRPPMEDRPERPELPGAASGDWRAALRAAGAVPDQLARRQPGGTAAADSTGAESAPAGSVPGGSPPTASDGEEEMARRKAAAKSTARTAGPAKGAVEGTSAAGALPPWLAGIDVPAGLAVGSGATELFEGDIARLRTLDDIAEAVEQCRRCPLYKTATHGVPGEGNPNADFFCVGEAPGANEDETGRPFVGQAGQLLTKILAAINLSRDEVFIANVLKHRPPGNRNPAPTEVEACSPYLLRQLELVKPRVIVAFGTFAAQTLLETKTPLGKLREHVHLYHGIPLVVTYHPAALLRNQAWKRPTWNDVQLARRILDLAPRA